jgi:pyruvate/2-oxoglutarate dehydrogenase complex dihydrolipoamide dehydrogenase (E3) component
MAEDFDAIVIGAGEAGTIVASRAVGTGKQVAMIYTSPYGSTCLNAGCVPSKFLIHRARIAHLARTAARFHIETSAPSVHLAAIVDEKNAMIAQHREDSFQSAQAAQKLTLIEGAARFTSNCEVVVADRTLRADTIFIATGMRPRIPSIDGLDRISVLTNESVMDLTALPAHLIVVGGGYIACELGQTFRRYGSEVTIIHSHAHLRPEEEPDVSTLLERAFAAEGIALVLDHRVERVEATAEGVRVAARARDGKERLIVGSHLFLAAGRQPNTDTLDLAAAGVATDTRGFVTINDYLETNVPGIWAIGDVNGQQPFTRVCQEEGKVAYANAFEGAQIKMQRSSLGYAIFTDPEIGSVGLTERQARERGYDVAAGLVTFDQVEKAEIIGETNGLIKYVVDRASHRLLGCHVIGPQAADLIYDAILVLRTAAASTRSRRRWGSSPRCTKAWRAPHAGCSARWRPTRSRARSSRPRSIRKSEGGERTDANSAGVPL